VVKFEDIDSEVEEVDEQEKASIQNSHDPCTVVLTNPKAIYEAKKGAFKRLAPQRSRQLRMLCAPLPWR
jgi:hypothetical protein